MSSTSFRECSTMSTCRGAIAFKVPASSSVPVFIATPCQISAEIAVLASIFRGRVDSLPRCCLSGRLHRRKPQPCLDDVRPAETAGKERGYPTQGFLDGVGTISRAKRRQILDSHVQQDQSAVVALRRFHRALPEREKTFAGVESRKGIPQ